MNRSISATLILCCLWSIELSASASTSVTIVERSPDKRIWVEQRTINSHPYETIVVSIDGRVYRLPDERVSYRDQGGNLSFYNEDGDTRIDHEFFLSPNADWLFVTRKLFHRVGVGYLYHLSGKQSVQTRPQGLRLDDAAIGFYAKHLHTPAPTIEDGARVIRFERWTSDGLIFSLGLSRDFDASGASYDVVGCYGLKSGHFGLISKTMTIE